MASTYTTSLKIQEIGSGDQSGIWGTTTNTNWTLIEQAVAGVQTITMSNSDYTLTNLNGVLDEARNMVLVVNGANSAIRKVVAPQNQPKLYVISNQTTGGYAITIGSPSGSIITIPNGVTAQVYTDGTNFYSAQTGSAGNFNVNGTLTASGITDTGALSAASLTVSGTLGVTGATTLSTGSISGIMTAPTAATGTNTTQLATTAFALANGIPSGAIVMWSGSIASIPSGWSLCNGSSGTPDLRDRFIVGAGSTYAVAATGGSADAIVVTHTHTATVTDPGHTHVTNPNPAYVGSAQGGHNGGGAQNPDGYPALSINSATTGISVTNTSTGSSGTNANLPPYYALAYIMKV